VPFTVARYPPCLGRLTMATRENRRRAQLAAIVRAGFGARLHWDDGLQIPQRAQDHDNAEDGQHRRHDGGVVAGEEGLHPVEGTVRPFAHE